MCVSAITEEMMEEANVTVTNDHGVNIKVEHDGQLISDNRYVFTDDWNGDLLVRSVSRLMSTGQVYPTNLKFNTDYYALGIPDVTVEGIGQMTIAEALILFNAGTQKDYVLKSAKTDKWGYTEEAVFETRDKAEWREQEKEEKAKAEAKAFKKAQEMAHTLIG